MRYVYIVFENIFDFWLGCGVNEMQEKRGSGGGDEMGGGGRECKGERERC